MTRMLTACVLLLFLRHVAEAQQVIDFKGYSQAQIEEARGNLEKWKAIATSKSEYTITEHGYILAEVDDSRGKLLWLPFGDRDSISKDIIEPGQEYRARVVPAGESKPRLVTIPPSKARRVVLFGEKPGTVQLSIVANGKDGAAPDEIKYVKLSVVPLVPAPGPAPGPTKPEDIKTDDELVKLALAEVKEGKGTLLDVMSLAEFYARVASTIDRADVFKTYGDFYTTMADCGKHLAGDPATVLPRFRAALAEQYRKEVGGTMGQAFDAEARAKAAKAFAAIAKRLEVIK